MTTQEAYELMRAYLTRPGARQAYSPDKGQCQYETRIEGETHKCAVGCLLTPASLRSKGATDAPLRNYMGGALGVLANYKPPELMFVEQLFLNDAQTVHDNPDNWKGGSFNAAALDMVAVQHGLRVVKNESPVPDRELVLP